MSDDAAAARAEIFRLMGSVQRFQLVRLAIEIDLPARLGDGPRTTAELAGALNLDAGRLARVLRGFCACGLLRVEAEDRFALTAMGRELIAVGPHTSAGLTRFTADFFYRAWAELPAWLRSGTGPFARAHGQLLFDFLGTDAGRKEFFYASMTSHNQALADAVLMAAELPERGLLVDVGGGEGELALSALVARQGLVGVVFDLPLLTEAAQARIASAGLAARCRFEMGDMFVEVPMGGDVYFLKWILHDWPDEQALRILRNVARAMPAGGSVQVIERVMPAERREQAEHAIRDLNMLVLNGGQERTQTEYADLFAASGLVLQRTAALADGFSLLTARRG